MCIIFHGSFGLLLGWAYAYGMLHPFRNIHRIPGRIVLQSLFMLRFAAAGIFIGAALYFGLEPVAVLPGFLFGYATGSAVYVRRVLVE